MEVIRDFKNDLLKRREISIVIESNSNPGFEKSSKAIADKFRVSDDIITVKNIYGKFGSNNFTIDAFIYNSAEDKNKLKSKKKLKETKAK